MNCRYQSRRSGWIAAYLIFASCFSLSAQSRPLQENPTAAQSAADPGKPEVYKAGKNISAPIPIHTVGMKISRVVRKANLRAIVTVNCYIEPDGTTSNVHAVQTLLDKDAGPINEPVTKELEDDAVEAVKHYKFKPAQEDGKPVRVELNVDVRF